MNDVIVPLVGFVSTVTDVIGVVPRSVSLVSTLPLMAVSSLPETASLTGSGAASTLMVATATFEFSAPSLTVTLMVRGVVDGVSVVLSNVMALSVLA